MAIINKVSFDARVIGTVLDINKENRTIAVYIPKLMPGIAASNISNQAIKTSNNAIVSGAEIGSQIKIRNSIWLKPRDYREPLPKVGSKVYILFIENNPKLGYWSAFNPNNNYEVIDEEKYKSLFGMYINNTEIPVFEEDKVILQFPEDTTVVMNTEDKTKTVKINPNVNYIISEERPADPKTGTLWFKPSTEELRLYKNDIFSRLLTEAEIDVKIAAAIAIQHP